MIDSHMSSNFYRLSFPQVKTGYNTKSFYDVNPIGYRTHYLSQVLQSDWLPYSLSITSTAI